MTPTGLNSARCGALVAGVVCVFGASSAGAPAVDFQRDIKPIFTERCYTCHGPDKQKNGLRLDRKADALKGGDSGPAFVPGKSADSRLYNYVAGLDPKIVMPQKGERLTSNQVALVKGWIDAGAPWPDESVTESGTRLTNHWSFFPPRRPPVPKIRHPPFPIRNPVDAFIAKAHATRNLTPAPEASRHVLIRRLSLDLLGLPPTPEEVDAFVKDRSSRAYEQLVERLLASPHYGERWGRHWLDLARWAETEGYEKNTFRASVWRYRDYVVKSFNQDKPYDRFLREQIAGDEIVPYSDENLIATGFLSGARYSNNEEDKAVQRNDVLVDIANMTASVTLGLTLNCAQCHDHKFDPLTSRDYYRWHGYFVRGQLVYALLKDPALWKHYEPNVPPEYEASKNLRKLIWEPGRAKLAEEARKKLSPEALAALDTAADQRTAEQKELAKKAEKELDIPREQVEKSLKDDDRKLVQELDKKIAALETELREKKPQIWGFYSPASSPHTVEMLAPKGDYPLPYEPEKLKTAKPAVFKRGDVHRAGDEVEPGLPEVLLAAAHGLQTTPLTRPSATHSSRPTREEGRVSGDSSRGADAPVPRLNTRSSLVDWLTDPTNPLTARVFVNLVWQQHFGRGIVETAGDFGLRGAKPTHPELLDWLATEFRESGWSVKHLHRLIVLSSAYRQASQPNAANEKIDPENKYLWRWTPRRLEAEAIRDSALFISGELDSTLGGPSVPPEDENKTIRRTIYLRQKRGDFPVAQAMFDSPTANESCPGRYVSTVPLQPLYLMNSAWMFKRAEAFARRVQAQTGGDVRRQIERAFLLAFGRLPEPNEREATLTLFTQAGATNDRQGEASSKPASDVALSRSLVQFCHALLNVNEFVYLE